MEKQKKSYGKTALIVLLLIVTIVSLVLATYAWAKYTSTEEGTATAQVAKWDVTFDGVTAGQDTFKQSYKHVVDQKIAPGTSGSFKITINPGDSEVCIKYRIVLESVAFKEEESTSENTIDNLKFFTKYEGGQYSNEITIGNTDDENLNGTIDLTNENHNAKNTSSSPVEKTIYWVWPYDLTDATSKGIEPEHADSKEYDQADTTAGQNITSMEVSYYVEAWQVQPEEIN